MIFRYRRVSRYFAACLSLVPGAVLGAQGAPAGARSSSALPPLPEAAAILRPQHRKLIAEAEAKAPKTGVSGNGRCVDATATRNSAGMAASGDFEAGSFSQYASIWHSGQGKLWWRPAHMTPDLVLTLRARRLDAPVVDTTFRFTTHATASTGGPSFFPTNMRLPSTGVWLLVARAGANWGCFVFQLR